MTMKAGVWIDHHKAVVVLLTDTGEDMLQILADSAASARSPAGLRAKNEGMSTGALGGGKREQNVAMKLRDYYDKVIACVRNAQAILILGPGEAKGEFRRRIATTKRIGHIAEMKTAAKLNDDQIAEYVRQHFQ
jgi:hypothetical protein